MSGSKNGKTPYRNGNCRLCHKYGHWAKECYRAKKGLKKSHISKFEVTEDTKEEVVFVKQYLLHVSAVEDSNCVDSFATKVQSPLITNDPFLTRICVENVAEMTFEIDTDASHSLLSQKIFERLQRDLAEIGRTPLKTLKQQVIIKLADGTTTAKHDGTVRMHIAKTVNCKEPILVLLSF